MDEQWEWLTLRELLRLLTVRKIWIDPDQGLMDLGLENVLAVEIKFSCKKVIQFQILSEAQDTVVPAI